MTTGGLDLDPDEIRVRLVTSGYTFSAAHIRWDNGSDDATDPSFSEASNGFGYITGGIDLVVASATASKVSARSRP